MIRRKTVWFLLLLIPLAFTTAAEDSFVTIFPDDIVWPEAAEGRGIITVLAGDPSKEGFYLLRAKFPPGAMSPPHTHSTARHVTVISGNWYTGTGPEFNKETMVPLGPGSYMMHPAGAAHYDGAKDEEVIVEIKGIGPVSTEWIEQK
jgi:quercetin dioxygenase-like cupin family protein